MTAADIIAILLAINLAASIAIIAVLGLRGTLRRMAGAQAAYLSWLIVPAAVAACLIPARVVTIEAPGVSQAVISSPEPEAFAADGQGAPAPAVTRESAPVPAPAAAGTSLPSQAGPPAGQVIDRAPGLVPMMPLELAVDIAAIVWAAGAIGALVFLFLRQALAVRALGPLARVSANVWRAAQSAIGPAVVGIFAPRIVLPANFEAAFDDTERKVVLAHEEAHLKGRHTAVKALTEIAVCLNWFNPLAHLAARAIAMDQELACDETVVQRYPAHRKAYAAVLLKTQAGPRAPLGCYWPAGSAPALKTRIVQIQRNATGRKRRVISGSVLVIAAIAAAGAAWASRPPQVRFVATEQSAPAADSPAPAPLQSGPQLPEPLPPEPQQTPAPQPPVSGQSAYDPTDPVYLRGKVERIDFSETKYTVFVRGSTLAASEFDEPRADTRLWELTPVSFWGDRDAVNADLLGNPVAVRGYNAKDKSCKPACRLLTRGIITPKSTALAAPAPSAPFGVSDVMRAYDMNQDYSAEGRVQRIEFSERTFDAYIAMAANGPLPGRIVQVRSEYRFPRAEIEKELNNQVVEVKGWPVRGGANRDIEVWSIYATCETVCAMYATEFTREDGAKIAPAGDQLLPPPVSTDPFFVRLPTTGRRETGVALTGKVREARTNDMIELVVEEVSRSPAAFTGPQAGTVWKVWFGPPPGAFGWQERTNPLNTAMNARNMVGHTITFSGTIGPYRGGSNVRSCQTDCKFLAQNIMTFE